RDPPQTYPPQCRPLVIVVVDEQRHLWMETDVVQSLQPRRALRLVIHSGHDRVGVDEREGDRDEVDLPCTVLCREPRDACRRDVSRAWVLWVGQGPARRLLAGAAPPNPIAARLAGARSTGLLARSRRLRFLRQTKHSLAVSPRGLRPRTPSPLGSLALARPA